MSQGTNPIDTLRRASLSAITQVTLWQQKFDPLMRSYAFQLRFLHNANLNGKSEEFVRVHNAYIKVIQDSQQNLQALHDTGQQILTAIHPVFENGQTLQIVLSRLADPITRLENEWKPYLQRHKYLSDKLANVENEYTRLQPPGTVFIRAEYERKS